MKTNDRVRKRIATDLDPGEEIQAVIRLLRRAQEGAPNRHGMISSQTGGLDIEGWLLGRHDLDAGEFPGTGPAERRDLVGGWMTVTPRRLLFHANDSGWKVVRPRPAELVVAMPRADVASIEYTDHDMSAIAWRTWLLRFRDGTWLLGNSMARGQKSQIGMDNESDLAVQALAGLAVELTPG